MRTLFNQVLVDIAQKDERIWMILADIGYGEIEPFRDAFPDRWYNCGVAEQNMTGVACGVALEGNIAITYSNANLPTLRCLEQIRNDVCYHNVNVKIVVIGGGLAYGPLYVSKVGNHEWLLNEHGLSIDKIAASVRKLMKRNG